MKKQSLFLFYFLSIYVFFQFFWWGYLLIHLTNDLKEINHNAGEKIMMIIGEGTVFILILLYGLWRLKASLVKERELNIRQHNFLLSVTHELKTPLSSMKLYIQTILKHKLNLEKTQELLEKSLIENKRLEEVVESILLSASIDNNQIRIHNTKLDVVEILNDLKIKYEKVACKTWININYNDKSSFIIADEFIVKTIFINLIENVIKYVGFDKVLDIDVFTNNNYLIISFKDKGIGIPINFKEKVFEKFVRLEDEDTRKNKGTGLGLYIVKEFVKLSNAKIELKCNKPNGSIFKISFPIDFLSI